MYSFIVDALNANIIHEEIVTDATCEQFHISAKRKAKKVFSLNGILLTVWLVPTNFACLRFMNDSRSLSRKVASRDEMTKEIPSENLTSLDIEAARSNNATLDAVCVCVSVCVCLCVCKCAQPMRNVCPKLEVLVDYEEMHEFK